MNQSKNNHNLQKIVDAACNVDQCMLVSDLVVCLAELLESQPERVYCYHRLPTIGNGTKSQLVSLIKKPKFLGLSFEYETIY